MLPYLATVSAYGSAAASAADGQSLLGTTELRDN